MKTLNDLQPGENAVVSEILSEDDMRRRLLDIGLTPYTRVECVGESPSRDPKAFLIRGAVIAIRNENCTDIILKEE